MQADDPELEAIRQRRMAQLMGARGGGGGGGGPRQQPPASAEEAQAQEEQRQAQEEQRRAMIVNLMQPSARDRRELLLRRSPTGVGCLPRATHPALPPTPPFHLPEPVPSSPALPGIPLLPPPVVSRIALVKPDKARAIEDMIIMAARRGQLQEKVRRVGWLGAAGVCCSTVHRLIVAAASAHAGVRGAAHRAARAGLGADGEEDQGGWGGWVGVGGWVWWTCSHRHVK